LKAKTAGVSSDQKRGARHPAARRAYEVALVDSLDALSQRDEGVAPGSRGEVGRRVADEEDRERVQVGVDSACDQSRFCQNTPD
jgi:hypothetical protein